jgi:hypothetical protein
MTCSICGEGEYVIKHNESGSMSYTEPVSHLDCVLKLQDDLDWLIDTLDFNLQESGFAQKALDERHAALSLRRGNALLEEQIRTRAEDAELDLELAQDELGGYKNLVSEEVTKRQQAEAELAALKGQTCGTCAVWGDYGWNRYPCRMVRTAAVFSCSEWATRAEEGGGE